MILFFIGEQQVYQMTYNGCTGKREIDEKLTIIAHHYQVSEEAIKFVFEDELEMTRGETQVPAALVDEVSELLLKDLNIRN